MDPKKGTFKSTNQKQSVEKSIAVFERRKIARGVDWHKVSATALRSALQSALAEGAAIMFAQASGGIGVMLMVMDGGAKDRDYAIDAEEMDGLLNQIIDAYGSKSEDVRLAMVNGQD